MQGCLQNKNKTKKFCPTLALDSKALGKVGPLGWLQGDKDTGGVKLSKADCEKVPEPGKESGSKSGENDVQKA